VATALSYDTEGTGPGLILIHANSSTGRGSWGPVLPGLADRYTVVLPNLPGSGDSPLPDGPLDVETLADQIVATADKAGLERFAVAGASAGAPVAIKVAGRYPERVTKLVTYGGYAKAHPTLRLQLEVWLSMLARDDPATGKLLLTFVFSDESLSARTEEQLDRLASGFVAHAAPGTAAQVGFASRVDVRDELGKVQAPTLVIVGADDAHVTPVHSREVAAGISGARLVEVTGGHGSISEHPDQTLSAMLTFLG
jgi:pimeloyl-ACP methyl ester carboxylesterase